MTPAELQWLSSHLGHDVSTHKKNYRLHPNSVEITKVGSLLMAVDNGRQHTGKQLVTVCILRDLTQWICSFCTYFCYSVVKT